jgi:TetR/AcrR family transcriptional regulator, transcriptional repressor for nem operon
MTSLVDTRQNIIDSGERVISHKGWAAVGINEVLTAAGVPKGSFYHWFSSKDAFGEAMMQNYFADYVAEMDVIFARTEMTAAARLMAYWEHWLDVQSLDDCQGRCLAVKLGAEVSDLSEPMRLALKEGTHAIIARVRTMIDAGLADGSLSVDGESQSTAQSLYSLWLGASVMAKIHRSIEPLHGALSATRRMLHLT